MGVYHKIVCDYHKETLDPGEIDDLGNKYDAIMHPEHPIGSLMMFTILTRWRKPIRIVTDDEEEYYSRRYVDVTAEMLKSQRKYYDLER